jgi:LacI family transcriptional regulator
MLRETSHHRRRILLALWYYDRDHHIGIARYAAEAGWILEDLITHVNELPTDWSGDGIISFHGKSKEYLQFLNRAKDSGIPIVDIGEYGHLSDFVRVRTHADEIAQMAVDFFAARGFSHVGFIQSSVQTRRRDAMRAAAHRRGLAFSVFSISEIVEQIKPIELPIGLLGATDGLAVMTMINLERAGILVPEQVAILGIDNDLCRCLPAPVPLSSIDTNREVLGYTSAKLLDQLMNRQPTPVRCVDVKPLGVIERESTDILAVDDLAVATAIRFIFMNYRKPIGVSDVAEQSGVSLRRLQVRFKEVLNRSILDVLNNRRIDHAKQMLTTTNAKIQSIADECGLGDGTRLIRAFSRCTGQTPGEYRSTHKRVVTAGAGTKG